MAGPHDAGAPDSAARLCAAGRILEEIAGASGACAWMLAVGAAPPAPGAREAAALWAGLALCGGGDPEAWRRFGEAAAEPIQLLRGLARLWLDPEAPDLEPAALTPLLALWLRDEALAPGLLLALAGERASPARKAEIHRLVSGGPYRAALARGFEASLSRARAALPPAPIQLAAAGAAFADALAAALPVYTGAMAFHELIAAPAAAASEGSLRRDGARDLDAALDYLAGAAPWRGSWEVQRFGVLGSAERPVGQWFVRGMILRALLELGRDARADVAALLEEIPPGELRYYGSFRGIPPDADSLGLMLELAAALAHPAVSTSPRAGTWIEVMLANAGADGVVPTWFSRTPQGAAASDPGFAWAGGDCPAVRLTLLCGLLSFDPARFDGLIQANARRVLDVAPGGRIEGAYHYEGWYAEHLLLRFARLYRARAASRPLEDRLAAIEAALRGQALGAQRLDGGWGSPLRTAARLTELAWAADEVAPPLSSPSPPSPSSPPPCDPSPPLDPLLDPRPKPALALARAVRYLGEHQLPDGSWPAEPLYRIPLKGGREGRHRGRALTTALCARALGAALAALAGEGVGDERAA